MRYYSTNGPSKTVTFHNAALNGLADDGGLFMPAEIPELSPDFWSRARKMSLTDLVFAVARAFLGDDIPPNDLRAIVADTLTFDIPLVTLAPDIHVLELFHGPTLAFKDVGARFMARIFAYLRRGASQPLTVLVATSGDTGSAVANGFSGVPGVRVVLLYPSGRVSHIQEQQLTTAGDTVTALEIQGSFDDCQRLVKEAFLDAELRNQLALTSANSINIARLLPQIFYYVWGWAQLDEHVRDIVFSVPSGNFGNLTAGLIAKRMGLPVARFVAATNANAVVPSYLSSGVFEPQSSRLTLSSAMDVGNPSNFARMLALYGGSRERLLRDVRAWSFTDEETIASMRELHTRYGYIADPHTAVGYLGLARYRAESMGTHVGIALATAHPAKFANICERALNHDVEIPKRLSACLEREKRAILLPNRFDSLRAHLLENYS